MGTHEQALPDVWSQDIERLYRNVRREHNLTYGCWVVEHIPNPCVVPSDEPNNYVQQKDGWRVKDLKGKTIVVVKSRVLAELIAAIPDLCDVDLRPSSAGLVSCEISGKAHRIPFVGTANPQEAFDSGYQQGFDDGSEIGYTTASEELTDDPCGDSGVA